MNKKLLLITLILSFLLIPLVQAGPIFDYFRSSGSSLDIVNFYNTNQSLIEFIIYLMVFISLTMGVFKERFGKKQTKTIAIAIGIALSFALATFMPGLTERLGPIAFLIFIALFWYLIFTSLEEGFKDKWIPMALAYLISFVILWILDPSGELKQYITKIQGMEWLIDILIIGFIIAIIFVLLKIKEIINNGNNP